MSNLTGAIDVHVHAGPSFFDRKHDAVELANTAEKRGMGGLVLKSHFGSTHKPARLAEARTNNLDVYSSVTLNSFVGGFNPVAVEHAIATEARVVWFPTFSAANFDAGGIGRDFPFSNQSLRVIDDDGEVKDEVREVLETIAEAERPITVGNGHISKEETFSLLDTIEEMGISTPYLVTHADFPFMGLSIADQIELAERGAILEKCYLPVVHGDINIIDVAESIRDIGPSQCVLSTDHGQLNNASPPEAYWEFVGRLQEVGLRERELTTLTSETPAHIVNPKT